MHYISSDCTACKAIIHCILNGILVTCVTTPTGDPFTTNTIGREREYACVEMFSTL